MASIIGQIKTIAADEIDAAERMCRVGAVRPWLADVAGVEVSVSGETLAARIAGEREEQVFVVVVAVRHQAVVIEARKIRPDSEAAHRARAPQRKAPFIVTAALGQRIEFQLLFGRARNEIHYTAV